jgi:predicted component of type VI protein secretion system
MICPSCGAQNHADFSFCLQCGHPLAQADQGGDQMGATRADIEPIESGTMAMPGLPSDFGGSGGARLRVDQGSVDDQFIDLNRPLTVIGRRQGSDIVIHDTNVSRMHAQITRDGSRLLIEDTNSSNGTIVNDERIEGTRELRAGDVIRIGDAVFIFEPQHAEEPAEGSTMAIDLDSPMTSLGGAPELIPPGMAMAQPNPLTPPPAIMDPSHTALSDNPVFEEEVSAPPPPSRPATPPPATRPQPLTANPAPVATGPSSSGSRNRSGSSAQSGSTAAALDGLRRELTEVGRDLQTFSGTLGGIADRVERLERALDAATGDLAQLADAIKGPDGTVLKELQGIIVDIERLAEGPALDEALKVLEQLASAPRDIELLLKLSQQASAIETALRIHGRMVAAAPRLRTTLARLTG